MALTFLQKKKIQRTLILVLGAVVLVTISVIWWGFFTTAPVPEGGIAPPPRRVEVNTGILSHPLLLKLDEPRAKTQIPSEVGRDNPMLPSF